MNKTKEDKRAEFLDMQDNPQKYTDRQVEELLEDDDIRQFAALMALTKRAMTDREERRKGVDVEAEWQRFARSHAPRHSRLVRVAAMIAAIVMAAGMVYAAAIGLGMVQNPLRRPQKAPAAGSAAVVRPAVGTAPDTVKTAAAPDTVVFEDAELGTILSQMAAWYKVKVEIQDEQAAHMRLYFTWNRKESLQQNVDLLNAFSRINIVCTDNTLIVQQP